MKNISNVLILTSPKAISTVESSFGKSLKINIDCARIADLLFEMTDSSIRISCKGKDLREYDFVWLQSPWAMIDVIYSISIYLDYNNIPHTHVNVAESKLSDFSLFSIHNISIPKTFFCSNKNFSEKCLYIGENLNYPVVIKDVKGSLGAKIFLAKNMEDFVSIVCTLDLKDKFICQEFIPNDFDFRIIVGHDKVLSGEKRIRQEELFRNNVFLGAKEEFLDITDIPEDVKELSLAAAKLLKLEWAGVDVVKSKETGKSYILEINRRPQLTAGTSEITAAEMFVRSIND